MLQKRVPCVLSMPAGTPAVGVLEASRVFAREQFALKHRYALELHIDQPHRMSTWSLSNQ
jgi:hypothetical protein